MCCHFPLYIHIMIYIPSITRVRDQARAINPLTPLPDKSLAYVLHLEPALLQALPKPLQHLQQVNEVVYRIHRPML